MGALQNTDTETKKVADFVVVEGHQNSFSVVK